MKNILVSLLSAILTPLLFAPALAQDDTPQSGPPNFVVILVDDAALMDFGSFGGEASTPNIDALAANGMLFTQHRATPFCAPSRAMLLTGMDNHLAGFGTIPEVLPPEHRGQPGYTMALEPGVETIATKLKRAGYRTYTTGKWHLGHGEGELPNHHGFDRSYVLDASGADSWEDKPYLPYYRDAPWFEDGEPVGLPDDFYSSTFIADQMQTYLEADEDRPEPFFAYLAFYSVHIPVAAPREYTAKYVDTYAAGWDPVRESRWRRAQEIGLVRDGTALAPQPETIPRWDALSEEDQRIMAKSLAVHAGALEAMDDEIGEFIAYLKDTGQFDNTVFVVSSDNGPEAGDPWGSQLQFWFDWVGYTRDYETLGERGSYVAIGPGGASAAAGPNHLFKFHAGDGGLRVPLIMSGPGVPVAERFESFTLMADIAPTLLDLANVTDVAPEGTKPFTGKSLSPVLNGTAETVYGPDDAVGFTTSGQAALIRGDYKLVRNLPPHGDSVWRLFNLVEDPGETTDLSDQFPELKAELRQEYQAYVDRVGVLELPEGYQVETQIGRNVIAKLWQYYWGRILFALLLFIAVLGAGLYFGTRFVIRLARN